MRDASVYQSLFDPPPIPLASSPRDLRGWTDPNPLPVVSLLPDGQTVVIRDDLLPGGTKVRALDYLIGHDPAFAQITEWVYGSSPAHGYAQWALGLVCQLYQKQAHLFMAARALDKLHRIQTLGLACPAATYHWVPNGMLSVTQKRARDYVAESPQTRALLPLGGNVPTAVSALAQVCASLPSGANCRVVPGITHRIIHTGLPFVPDTIWSVLSSGTLSRALQVAFPDAEVYGVTVGHTPTPEERGRAVLVASSYRFDASVCAADAPPYPSASSYDAKVWPCYRTWRQSHPNRKVLIWNVGA